MLVCTKDSMGQWRGSCVHPKREKWGDQDSTHVKLHLYSILRLAHYPTYRIDSAMQCHKEVICPKLSFPCCIYLFSDQIIIFIFFDQTVIFVQIMGQKRLFQNNNNNFLKSCFGKGSSRHLFPQYHNLPIRIIKLSKHFFSILNTRSVVPSDLPPLVGWPFGLKFRKKKKKKD